MKSSKFVVSADYLVQPYTYDKVTICHLGNNSDAIRNYNAGADPVYVKGGPEIQKGGPGG